MSRYDFAGRDNSELVSVIIPVFNCEKTLKESVDSVINQSYKQIQIVLVDDGSTDDSFKVCKQLEAIDQRVETIRKPNGGVSSARNLGMKNARGEYLMFVDADDFLHHRAIELMYKAIKETGCVMAVGDFVKTKMIAEKELDQLDTIVTQRMNAIDFLKQTLYSLDRGTVCGKLWDKQVLKQISFKPYSHIEDYVFIVDSLLDSSLCDGLICIHGIPLYYYIQRSDSATHALSLKHLSDTLEAADYLTKRTAAEREDVHRAVMCYALNAVLFTLVHTNQTRANNREIIKKAKKMIAEYQSEVLHDVNAPLKVKAASVLASVSVRVLKQIYALFR